MNGNEPAQRIWFIIIFFIVAFVINSTPHLSSSTQNVRLQQPGLGVASQQQQLEMERQAAAQKAAMDVAQEHARFLARYLNTSTLKSSGTETLALVTATQDGKLDSPVSTALANHFKSGNVKISTSFFKPEFVSDKLFANVFDGSTEILSKLELANSLDALLLARETVQYSKDSSLDNLISANMQLEIQVVPVAGNIQNQSWTFTANGAGFSQAEAKSMAVERLIKQMNNDTKMSLGF